MLQLGKEITALAWASALGLALGLTPSCSSGTFGGDSGQRAQHAATPKPGSKDGKDGPGDAVNGNLGNSDSTGGGGKVGSNDTTGGPGTVGTKDSTGGGVGVDGGPLGTVNPSATPGTLGGLDGGEVTLRIHEDMLVEQLLEGSGDADGIWTVQITKTDANGIPSSVPMWSYKETQEHVAWQQTATDLCDKAASTGGNSDSFFTVRFIEDDGDVKTTSTTCSSLSGTQMQVLQTGGGVSNPEVTVDKGGCLIGTAVDRGSDNTFRFTCPHSNVHIQGLMHQ